LNGRLLYIQNLRPYGLLTSYILSLTLVPVYYNNDTFPHTNSEQK